MYINLDFFIDFEDGYEEKKPKIDVYKRYLKPKVEQALDSDMFKRPWGCKSNLDFED